MTVQNITDQQLITELYRRKYTLHDIEGAFYAIEEMAGDRYDRIWGNGEEGLHGAESDKPKK